VRTAAAKVTTALRFSAVIGNFPRAGATSDNGVHGLSKLGSETFFRWRVEQDVVLTVTVARGRLGAFGSLSQSTRWPSRFARSFNSSSSGSGALARDIRGKVVNSKETCLFWAANGIAWKFPLQF
jgi:hypothetical protein